MTMTIEQKAQRYDESLKRAKKLYEQGTITESLNYVFPELKESEDEQSRKWILEYLYDGLRRSDEQFKGQFKCAIAWLEKQGEQNLIMAKSPQLGEQKPFDYEDANIQQKDFAPKSAMEAVKEKKIDNANKVEPKDYSSIDPHFGKPADKVKPKFHEGEWVVNNDSGCVYQIKSIRDDEYCLCPLDSEVHGYLRITDIDNECYLWTIADARDGDVLVASDGSIFIFAGVDDCACKYYVALTADNYVKINKETKGGYWETSRAVHPATKEQRDTLEKAMTDAGYIFDFESKELKKLGQSEVTKMSDQEEIAEIPFGAKNSELQEAIYYIPKGFHAEIDDDKVVIKKGEKPAAWSEEDEDVINKAESWLDTLCDYLKDSSSECIPDIKDVINKLKSLRPQKQWKPSEEQIKALHDFNLTGNISYAGQGQVLIELYNDLKKLTE